MLWVMWKHDYHGLGCTAEKWQSQRMTAVRSSPILPAFGIALGLVALGRTPAHAAENEPVSPSAHASALPKLLESHDQTELLMLLDELAAGPEAARAARAVATLLAAGQPDVVADHALEALGRLHAREGREVLVDFTQHRRADARRRAYTALAAMKDASDVEVVKQGLRDSAPEVRSAAARGLGELRSSAATPDLLRALGRGVSEAAETLGRVGAADSVDAFSAYLGKQPLDVMLAGYAQYLQRSDIPDATKLKIVADLENTSGPVVKRFLSEWLTANAARCSPKLQRALEAASVRMRGGAAPSRPESAQ
jgi:hypothetical protein